MHITCGVHGPDGLRGHTGYMSMYMHASYGGATHHLIYLEVSSPLGR